MNPPSKPLSPFAPPLTVLTGCLLIIFVFLGLSNMSTINETAGERISGVFHQERPADFLSFYVAGRLVWHGRAHDLYKPDVIEQQQEALVGHDVGGSGDGLPFFSPPFVAALLAPLATLSLSAFTAVFLAILIATVLAGGYLLQKIVPITSTKQRVLFWFGYISFLPVSWLLLEEQLTMFVFAGWLAFALLETKGEHRWSGAALALALVKPQSIAIILVLLVWKGRWQTLGSFALVAAPLVLVSIAVSGPGSLYEYPKFLLDSASWHGHGINATGMFSWNAIPANILYVSSPPLLSYLPLTLLTFAAVAFAWRGIAWEPETPQFLLLCAITFLAAMLTNPHFYLQDVTLVCIPIALAAAWRSRTGRSMTGLGRIAALTWILGLYGPLLQQDERITVLTPWFALLLIAGLIELARSQKTEQVASRSDTSIEAIAA